MTMLLRGALCVSFLTCFSGPVHAAEPLYVDVPIGGYGTITAPGLRTAQTELRKIPGGTDIVPAREFQNGYALSMKDMLSATPGVLAQPRWGEESRLSIRGSGLSRSFHLRGIALLQDGIPLTFADGSGDFQEIDPLILQHVEVYRGGQALRYGASSLGGAVNLVTPTARTAGYETLLRAEGGSFQTARIHAQGTKVFSKGDIWAATTRKLSQGFRRQSEQNTVRFSGNAGVMLNQDAETRFYLSYNDIEQEVPGTITKEQALKTPREVPAINITGDYARDIPSLRLANKTAFRFGDNETAELGGYINNKDLYHPIFQVIDQKSLDTGVFGRVKGQHDMGGLQSDYTIGINTAHGVNNAKRFVNDRGNRGDIRADARQVANNIELYGENSIEFLPSWNFITGVQANWAYRDYSDFLNGANDADKIYQSLNPKIGVMWEFTPQSEFYASLTRSSEVPTFSELVQGAFPGFVPVKLQKAWTAEIGTRGKEGAFSWDATLYHARVKDELLNFTVTPDVPASTFNADETIHQGIELGAGWQATPALSFQTVYTFNDFQFDGDNEFGDNELAGAPPHQIRFSARYEQDGFSLEPSVEWGPEAAFVDYANTMKADSYAVANVKAGLDINPNISIFLEGRNLTNEKYIASFSTLTDASAVDTNVFYPGDGRAAYGGIIIKF